MTFGGVLLLTYHVFGPCGGSDFSSLSSLLFPFSADAPTIRPILLTFVSFENCSINNNRFFIYLYIYIPVYIE